MVLPEQPVTLTVEQIGALNRELATMRHDINNNLSLVLAAVELIRMKPELADRMIATVLEQPAKVMQAMQKFSSEFEKTCGIKRAGPGHPGAFESGGHSPGSWS